MKIAKSIAFNELRTVLKEWIIMEALTKQDSFTDVINKERVVLYFTAGWCPDCTVIEPVLPEIEAAYPAYSFIKVDRDQFIDVCQEYEIFGIPSFIAFQNGKEVGRFVSKDRKTKEEIMNFMNHLPS
ncbi:thioredoxin family protein [Virgibacillus pantothenticus]|nr:thioredoxin family protein [Virgibacillus pantothenticus]MBU8602921.1 thioredoxin family protein [Virgibacillus pantothenticus]MBU8636993.1 thioredoxin family protein [Virgibacillus pantothenticus]MBU8644799.1 thioredoxin family protein [Virgibacillus pantothenticus]MBU8648920.1 thioredoxin family protein [Virgibacillus pantothenticus]